MAIGVLAATNVLSLSVAVIALEQHGPRGERGRQGVSGRAGPTGPRGRAGKPGKRGAAAPPPLVLPAPTDTALRKRVDSIDRLVQTLCQHGLVDGYEPSATLTTPTLHYFYCY